MIFLFAASENSIFDIPFALEHMGHTVTVLDEIPFHIMDLNYTFPLQPAEQALQTGQYDFVISYNYIPLLSDLCENYKTIYIAWIYDSPMTTLFHSSVFHSVNRIFLFDHALYERMQQIGIPHIYYMPLAANTTRINALSLSDKDRKRYSCDISFVGSLYEKNAYNDSRNQMPAEAAVPMNHYLMHYLCNWNAVRSWPVLSSNLTHYFLDTDPKLKASAEEYELPANMYLGLLYLSRKLAEMERITVLNTLAEQFPVDLYTNSQSDQIDILRKHAPVNYYTELNKVYHFSRINLNITIPSIETGIPLRIFDIMVCGGFVLSNYQKEFDSLFTPGKDIVLFHDLTELKEQAASYLSHEQERLIIAAEGYRTVNRYYTYEIQLQKMLIICGQPENDH